MLHYQTGLGLSLCVVEVSQMTTKLQDQKEDLEHES
jgi:hypothetical protein